MNDTNESRLIARAKSDPAAFDNLYRRHVDRIFNYVYHRVGDVDEAEDLTSRTFHRALASLPGYADEGAPFSAWLYRIAHNLIANWHRDRGRRQTVPLEGVDVAEDADTDAERAFTQEQVRAAIRRLDPDRQSLLVLKFGDGLSNDEIGMVLGRSEGAIKSLYHRTLIALRDDLGSV